MNGIPFSAELARKCKPLCGFDVGPNLYHVMLGRFESGNGLVIWREGGSFAAMYPLETVAQFADGIEKAAADRN